jgi:hypothetical protein
MLDVLAHILIFGSVQHLYASYIYVLCLPASTTLFFMRLLRISLRLFMCYGPTSHKREGRGARGGKGAIARAGNMSNGTKKARADRVRVNKS